MELPPPPAIPPSTPLVTPEPATEHGVRLWLLILALPAFFLCAWTLGARDQEPFVTHAAKLLAPVGAVGLMLSAGIFLVVDMFRGLGQNRRVPTVLALVALAVAAVIPLVLLQRTPFALEDPVAPSSSFVTVVSGRPYGSYDLWLIRGAGDVRDDELVDLTPNIGPAWGPDLSPDGRHVVFVSTEDGVQHVYVLDLDETGSPQGSPRKITSGLGGQSRASWMPDGRTVMFTVRGAKGFDIASVASDGSGMRRLTDDGRSYDASPTADGTGIAYVRGFQDDADIWTMRADGTAAAKAFDTGGADYSPQWFSDGRLAFTGGIGSGSDVWVGAPGSAPTDITPDSAFQDFVVGSTAEGLILFASDRAQADGTFLYSMQPDGSEVHLVAIL